MPATTTPNRIERLADYYAAFAARKARTTPVFTFPPEPRSIGILERGKLILQGQIVLAGQKIALTRHALWQHDFLNRAAALEAQSFGWLDDLAAVGTVQARDLAQDWLIGWLDAFGRGQGLGWCAPTCAHRLIAWIHHAEFLLSAGDLELRRRFFDGLAQHGEFLRRRGPKAPKGIARLEAGLGLLYAALFLRGMAGQIRKALEMIGQDCAALIDEKGAIASRNPEELLDILTLLTWAIAALKEAGHPAPSSLIENINRIAPTLRLLRHVDGELARFHGGGAGLEGRLDQALSNSQSLPAPARLAFAMGYARLSAARTSVILDAAAPPEGKYSATAHASTAAFELTSGRRPVIVNCGSGLSFGEDWALAGRASQSHSTLSLTGLSSSRFGKGQDGKLSIRAQITDLACPQVNPLDGQAQLRVSHDGWVKSHGLHTTREITLFPDGRTLVGADYLNAIGPDARAQFSASLAQNRNQSLPFTIRFHLHPDVDAALDQDGTAISLRLRSGEIWIFKLEDAAKLSLEPSAYLEKSHLEPKHSLQIVVSAQTREFDTRIGWTLAKAQDTPLAIRDLGRDDPVPI